MALARAGGASALLDLLLYDGWIREHSAVEEGVAVAEHGRAAESARAVESPPAAS